MPSTFVTLYFKEKKKYVFSLPGNPVSAGVCTHLFLLPYLRMISDRKSITHCFKAKVILYFMYCLCTYILYTSLFLYTCS